MGHVMIGSVQEGRTSFERSLILLAVFVLGPLVIWYIAASELLRPIPSTDQVRSHTWQVVAIGDQDLTADITLRFAAASVSVSSPCGTDNTDWVYDTDGAAVGFGHMTLSEQSCSAVEQDEADRVASALFAVDEWRESGAEIVLESSTSDMTVRLR
jgi:hypothetical protein